MRVRAVGGIAIDESGGRESERPIAPNIDSARDRHDQRDLSHVSGTGLSAKLNILFRIGRYPEMS